MIEISSQRRVSYPYADPAGLFDITTGPGAGPGWDGPTGLGTPDGVGAFKAPSTTGP